MNITQDGRMMQMSTPLGDDFLLVNKLSATEGLSQLFRYDIEMLHEEDEAGDEPHNIMHSQLLHQTIGIKIEQTDGTSRVFTGMVSSFSQGNRDERFSYYHATLVPDVWVLTRKFQSRIFQQKSVPDILKKVFEGFNMEWQIQGTFEPRNYCVQYRETDFDFASRLMETEGIYYYFEHTDKGHKMIVANTTQSHKDCPTKKTIPFVTELSSDEEFLGSIGTWLVDYNVQSGVTRLWDYNFELPTKKLEAEKMARDLIKAKSDFEVYDYPGGYAKRFDGVDKGGGEQAAELQKIFTDNKRTTEIRMQEIDAGHEIASGLSDCCSMTAGHRFTLQNHPTKKFNILYTITSIRHEIEQSPDYNSQEVSTPYRNSFKCIQNIYPFRPPRKTPKPIVYGSQTAFVVGPAGEEIFTDKYGRVKAQFHWDRDGKVDANSSCWMRVGQSWAGKNWGTMFIPRIGMEVIVDFLEGDPDQPIITGCVYNAEAMPPYKLPDEKTKATIKTYSSKGGGGFNELRFEDKKGSEQIFIHGEKNIDTRVKHDSFEWIGNDRHLIVTKDKLEKIGGDKHLQVLGDKNEKVTGTVSRNVQQDIQEKAGKNYALDAGTEIHLKSGMNVTIETGTTLTLKVGGNFININPSGVYIKGTLVFINSGGSAGSGSGSNPAAPTDPKEADKAEPGARPAPPPPAAPAPVFSYSPAALVMKQAAKTGTPFCEICERGAQ